MKELVKNKKYMLFFTGNILSVFGDSIYYLALMSIVMATDNPQLALTCIVISETLPNLLNPLLSSYSDLTKNKWRNLIISSLTRTLLYLGVAFVVMHELNISVILIICLLNFISDILGKYATGLSMPIKMRLAGEKLYAQIGAMEGTMQALIQILANSIGLILLTYLGIVNLAILNSTTFLLSGIIFLFVAKLLSGKERQFIVEKQGSVKTHLIDTLKTIMNDKKTISLLSIIIILNIILSSIIPAFQITLLNDSALIINDYPTTIAIVNLIISIAMMCGTYLSQYLFKKSINKQITVIAATVLFYIISYQFLNVYTKLLSIGLVAFFVGTISGKLFGIFADRIAQEKIGSFFGSLNMLLTIAVPIGSFLGVFLSQISHGIIYSAVTLILTLIAFYANFQTRSVLDK